MKIPEFKIERLNTVENTHWEVLVSLENGQKYFGSFWSVTKLYSENISNLDCSVILVNDLNDVSIRNRISDYLRNDGFYTSFFPLNRKATDNLINLVS